MSRAAPFPAMSAMAGCSGKDQLTRKQADGIVRRTRSNLRPYKCSHCGYFHVGHSNHRPKEMKVVRRG